MIRLRADEGGHSGRVCRDLQTSHDDVLHVPQPCLTQLSQCTVRRRASDEGLSPPTHPSTAHLKRNATPSAAQTLGRHSRCARGRWPHLRVVGPSGKGQ